MVGCVTILQQHKPDPVPTLTPFRPRSLFIEDEYAHIAFNVALHAKRIGGPQRIAVIIQIDASGRYRVGSNEQERAQKQFLHVAGLLSG